MRIEYRIPWIANLYAESVTSVDIISFGSESCLVPLLTQDISNVLVDIQNKNITVKLVTPRIPQHEMHRLLKLLRTIQNRGVPVDIVVNDWGLFYYCSQFPEIFHMHIGRQLCRSLLDCPWNNEILSNESEAVAQVICGHPYTAKDRSEHLLHKGVIGIEVNAATNDIRAFDDLRTHGLQVALHYDEYLLSCGAVCLARRLEPDMPCMRLCEKRFDAVPLGKWLNSFDNKVPFSTDEQLLLQGMQISGKKVLLPQKASTDSFKEVDTLIISKESSLNKILDRRTDQ